MDAEFWLQRWRNAEIGFHQSRPLPLLCKHWPALQLAQGARVFVPLCGKSLDMVWLAEQGHDVLGVELSPLAVDAFFAERGLTTRRFESRYGTHAIAGWQGRDIELICGDAFALDTEALRGCDAFYDRAALIALPPALRERYGAWLDSALPADSRGLLITLEYEQREMAGPPFSVDEDEVRRGFAPRREVTLLERRDLLDDEPGFAARGLRALHTAVYLLTPRPSPLRTDARTPP